MTNIVRQYVGARYTPKFIDGGWNETTAYEALSVVDNGMGTTYISGKPVPAGTPLSNREYWHLYGASSGAIVNLQDQIDDINGNIGDLSDLSTIDKTSIVNAINSIESKKYIFIMDSYGTFHTDEDNYNYVQLACAMCGLVEGSDYYQFYRSGAGFCAEAPQKFLELLQESESVISDKTKITDIVVFGSANDQLGTYNTIRSGINSFWNYVKVNYPNATLHIGCLSKSIEAAVYMNKLPTVYSAYRDMIDYGIDYIDNSEAIMSWLNLFRSDALHPTEAAIDVIARAVAPWIKYRHLNIYRKLSASDLFDFTGSNFLELRSGATQPQVIMSQDNDNITVQCASSGILAYCTTKIARTIRNGTTVFANEFNLVDSLFYPERGNSSSWYGALWHGNDRYNAILTFMTDGIAANNKKIHCQLIVENPGENIDINANENVTLIFPQPMPITL